ncbi:F-box/kelch-repeat protein At3g18720-like [Rosa chinensis]|uniref:F-box/kelch-repeat protein At3g18720-like n=1 Tax=Rosa chinensis TaxID=74649 RepID=UPI000D08C632|nr:F-box/kelch-repeat protein At3g18720-like [Rosa chinensis]
MDDYNRWSKHLPDELIEMIVKRLPLVDSVRFAAVCPSWRSVSSQCFQRVTRLPWLLKSIKFLDSESVNYNIYSTSEDTFYDLKFRRENNKLDASRSDKIRCSGSINGWLIMSEWMSQKNMIHSAKTTSVNYFLNPMTGDRIKLPQLTGIIPWSSAASSDPRCSDCIVATCLDPKYDSDRNIAIEGGMKLVFCRPGSHESCPWEGQKRYIVYVKFHEDGKLYVLELADWPRYELAVLVLVSVPVLDPLNQCQGKGRCEKIIAYREKTILAGMPSGDSPSGIGRPSFFWSSKGEFILVWGRDWPGRKFRALKMDDKSGYNPVWVDLETNDVAEDEVVLVSASHSTSMSKLKTFMTTIDEAFLGLYKFFTCHGSLNCENLLPGVWFTPNITR